VRRWRSARYAIGEEGELDLLSVRRMGPDPLTARRRGPDPPSM